MPAAVQIPRHFNPAKPCIVAAVPSGSRSLYGGIALAEWALFKGCAVALPGKGTDTGFHLLGAEAATYAVDDIDGVYRSADALGDDAQFALRDSRRLDAYLAANPHRIATKHAHSQINPERLWGQFALDGIEFAFWALNDHFDTQGNTAQIAALIEKTRWSSRPAPRTAAAWRCARSRTTARADRRPGGHRAEHRPARTAAS